MARPQRPRHQANPPSTRLISANVLHRVMQDGAFVNLALSSALTRETQLPPMDRGFVTELVYGTLRHLALVDRAIEQSAERKLKKIDELLVDILRIAAYEAIHLHSPDHALVNEAVNAARKTRGEGASKFVNGVLRGLLRLRDTGALAPTTRKGPDGLIERSGLPAWLAADVIARLGEDGAEAFGRASLERPRVHLCVPAGGSARDGFLEELLKKGVQAAAHPACETAIVVEEGAAAIEAIADDRRALVQNTASQLVALEAVGALVSAGGRRAADLCSAPGGKSALLSVRGIDVVAGDIHIDKLLLARKQWKRLGVNPHAVNLDARQPPFATGSMDLVLLDAPCTGSGLLARRPEIKLRRSADDLGRLVALQRELLDAAAALVRPGGVLLYSVCSVATAEGLAQTRLFLQRQPAFSLEPWASNLPPDALSDGMLTLWPHRHGTDGFFAARLRRT